MRAVVRSVTEEYLSVDLYNEEGANITDMLVKFGYVVRDGDSTAVSNDDDMPSLASSVSQTTTSQNGVSIALYYILHSPKINRRKSCVKLFCIRHGLEMHCVCYKLNRLDSIFFSSLFCCSIGHVSNFPTMSHWTGIS